MFCSLEALSDQLGPVLDSGKHVSAVDKVKCVWGMRPFQLDVIDLEFDTNYS